MVVVEAVEAVVVGEGEEVELVTVTMVAGGDKRVVVLVQVMVNKEALAGDLPPRKQHQGTDGDLEILAAVVGELTSPVRT